MAFTVPTFNLVCDVYTGPWSTKVLRLSPSCNLAIGRRTAQPSLDWGANAPQTHALPRLLLPALTDIRDGSCNGVQDVVEVPSGSGRWYQVLGVDDVAKGFPNEFRFADLSKIYQQMNPIDYPGLQWPTPIP
jgi:hypothetical protein